MAVKTEKTNNITLPKLWESPRLNPVFTEFPPIRLAEDVWKLSAERTSPPAGLHGMGLKRWRAGAKAIREVGDKLKQESPRFQAVLQKMQGAQVDATLERLAGKIGKENRDRDFKIYLFGLRLPLIKNRQAYSTVFEVTFEDKNLPHRYFVAEPDLQSNLQVYPLREIPYSRAFSEHNKILVRYKTDNFLAAALHLPPEQITALNNGVGRRRFEHLQNLVYYGLELTAPQGMTKVLGELQQSENPDETVAEYIARKNKLHEGIRATIGEAMEKGIVNNETAAKAFELLDQIEELSAQAFKARFQTHAAILAGARVFDIAIESPRFGTVLTVSHAFGIRQNEEGKREFSLVDLATGQHYEGRLPAGEPDSSSACAGMEAAWEKFLIENYYKEMDNSHPTFAILSHPCWREPKVANTSAHQRIPYRLVGMTETSMDELFRLLTLTPLFESPYESVEGSEPWVSWYTMGSLMGGMIPKLNRVVFHPVGLAVAGGGLMIHQLLPGPKSDTELAELLADTDPARLASGLAAGIPLTRLMHLIPRMNWITAAAGIILLAKIGHDKLHRKNLGIQADPATTVTARILLAKILEEMEKAPSQ